MGWDSVHHATAVNGSESQRALRLCRKTFAIVLSLALVNNTIGAGMDTVGALTRREADSEDAQEPVHRDERKVDFPAAKVGQLRQCSL
jgi:hypothetical protein